MNVFRRLAFAPVFLLVGCSWLTGPDGLFPDNTQNYRDSPELNELVIPPQVGEARIEPIYPIPPVTNRVAVMDANAAPRPAPLTSGAQTDSVRIQRLGDDSWALVAVSPGQLWPQVRAFLTSSGVAVAASDASAGLIDTQYVTLTDRPLPTRFRFRVDTGVQRNTSELHVLQQDKGVTNTGWPQSSDDLELESTMLRNVAQFIANSAEAAPVSMIADQAMSDSGRIALEDSEELTRLRLRLPFDRAWASVSKALPESGFVVDDRNRNEGVFYVTFSGPQDQQEEGWFDWLWGGEEQHPMAGKQFLLNVRPAEDNLVFLTLDGPNGTAVERREQQVLLTILKGNIN